MKKLINKIIGFVLIISGISGLLLAGSDISPIKDQVIVNTAGLLLFGVSCLLGSIHARDELHPIDWIIYKFDELTFFFRL